MGAAALLGLVAFFVLSLIQPARAAAHPLGNFTINSYSRLDLHADVIRVRYIVDMAEIPTFQEMDAIDTNADGRVSDAERRAYLSAKAVELRGGLHLVAEGSSLPLALLSHELSFPSGQAGLKTLRLVLTFEAPAVAERLSLEYRDDNFGDRLGWREIVVRPAEGVTLISSTAPAADLTNELRTYPDDLLTSPLNVRAVTVDFAPGAGVSAPPLEPAQVAALDVAPPRPGNAFASLVNVENVSLAVILISFFVALGFGALHALEPGHGKVFVAAYFVGAGGSVRHAMLLGFVVAVSHTVGVFVIGLVVLFGSRYILPEHLYPWLTLVAGLLVVAVGIRLFLARVGGFQGLAGLLDHRLRHLHPHHHAHRHVPGSTTTAAVTVPSRKSLFAIGLIDGMVPSPSTLVVLVAAISLNRIGLGLLLILAFSIGLAAVLTFMALIVVYVRRLLDWLGSARGTWISPATAWLPFLTVSLDGRLLRILPLGGALVLITIGLVYTVRALAEPQLLGL